MWAPTDVEARVLSDSQYVLEEAKLKLDFFERKIRGLLMRAPVKEADIQTLDVDEILGGLAVGRFESAGIDKDGLDCAGSECEAEGQAVSGITLDNIGIARSEVRRFDIFEGVVSERDVQSEGGRPFLIMGAAK